MKLYLMRHGESIPAGVDNERPLSDSGKEDIHQLAKFLAPLKITINQVFYSEKLRAQQTAKILLSAISSQEAPQVKSELDPMAPVDFIIDEINSWEGDTLLVGHMPFMGKLAAKLVTGDEYNNTVIFKPGAIACLEEIEKSQWVICWVLTPELFACH